MYYATPAITPFTYAAYAYCRDVASCQLFIELTLMAIIEILR